MSLPQGSTGNDTDDDLGPPPPLPSSLCTALPGTTNATTTPSNPASANEVNANKTTKRKQTRRTCGRGQGWELRARRPLPALLREWSALTSARKQPFCAILSEVWLGNSTVARNGVFGSASYYFQLIISSCDRFVRNHAQRSPGKRLVRQGYAALA